MKRPRVDPGAERRSKGPSSFRGRHVFPRSVETAAQTSVPSPGPEAASRRSYQVAPRLPSFATARLGKKGWAASCTTADGALQVSPPSAERANQTVEVPVRWFSNHVTYSRRPLLAAEMSWPIERISVPRSGSLVIVNGKLAIGAAGDQVAPPSVERETATVFWSPSFVSVPSTNTSTSSPLGSARSRLFCDPMLLL